MDNSCTYRGNREEALMAYLYDAADPTDRATFDAHLAGCAACRAEIDEFGLVRTQLAEWTPPEPAAGWMSDQARYGSQGRRRSRGAALGEMPAWAQIAAAMVLLGVAAGAANLNVSYGENGLSVRTGWMAPDAMAPATSGERTPANATPASTVDATTWRAELAALDQQIRSDFAPALARSSGSGRDASADAALLRRVRELIEDSEKRQQTELALRVAEVAVAMRSQRVADLANVDRNFNVIQARTGADIVKLYQRQQDLATRFAASR